jgi:RND family efflux transporter MFP subunit
VRAAGNVEVSEERFVVLQVEGTVATVLVAVGDQVKTGDLLLSLDTVDLERAVRQAELGVAASQAQIDQLNEGADPSDLAAAEASLASAQEQYRNLLAGKNQDELTQLSANLDKAQIALQQAQAEYDKVSWRNDVGMTTQAATLQKATIDYDSARAAYDDATKKASQADVAAAEASIASAQATVDKLLKKTGAAEMHSAEISLAQAQLSLEEAQVRLAEAQVRAPINGTILAVNAEVGQRAAAGLQAFTIADLGLLELTANVAEVDIAPIQIGQEAQVTIDALPGRTLQGMVKQIAPSSSTSQGVVNYPVTVQLTDPDLSGVRPGMTGVATLINSQKQAGWLVPSNAITQNSDGAVVTVVRDGQSLPVRVVPGTPQGEWTFVQSADLQEGDQVVGSVASYLNKNQNRFGVGGGGPPPGMGGGGRPD